ncbi:MAG TPA: 50S ribosomal protein L3 [Acidimicrobiaceae bacterium]|nr:50S ribosomal protein L3 [Acidimicrobiaceae bacterium]HCB36675.1 50S ribosomal protein L3 [Acidimicrobiaceae bacterium]
MASKALVATKVGMTQQWDDDGRVVPVTVLRVSDCRVVQVKTTERDGYTAVQVTYGHRSADKLSSPEAGHFATAGVEPGRRLVELRVDDVDDLPVGTALDASVFAPGELVDVTAVSKGKGFAGVMKRHNFSGQTASHGVHLAHRVPGSIGACATPSRVFRGTKMPGRMGGTKATTLNLTVVAADPEADLVLVKGSVPGPKGGTVVIRNAVKAPPAAAA